MSLELSKCGNCKEKKIMKNSNTYCITCRSKIKIKFRNGKGLSNSTLWNRHKDGFREAEKKMIQKKYI